MRCDNAKYLLAPADLNQAGQSGLAKGHLAKYHGIGGEGEVVGPGGGDEAEDRGM